MAQWFLQKQIDEISAEIRALRTSVYNVDGAIDEGNPLAVKAADLEKKLDNLQQLLQSGDAKVQLTGQNVVSVQSSTDLSRAAIGAVVHTVKAVSRRGIEEGFAPSGSAIPALATEQVISVSGAGYIHWVQFQTGFASEGLYTGVDVNGSNIAFASSFRQLIDAQGGTPIVGPEGRIGNNYITLHDADDNRYGYAFDASSHPLRFTTGLAVRVVNNTAESKDVATVALYAVLSSERHMFSVRDGDYDAAHIHQLVAHACNLDMDDVTVSVAYQQLSEGTMPRMCVDVFLRGNPPELARGVIADVLAGAGIIITE